MEWYPSLFLEFFHQLVFPYRHTCSSETHGTIPTSLLVFVESPEAVLTTILYMPFDVMYYLFLCVLLLLCQPGLLSMEWYPFLFPKFFHQFIFSYRHMYVFFEDTWHHSYIFTCFCGKRFYFPCFLTFYGVQAALWQFES